MSKVHYIVRRSRMGRFNFTLISEGGRITGSVTVPITGKTGTDIERDAHDQIRHLAETFAGITSPVAPSPVALSADNASSTKCGHAMSRPLSAIAS